MIRYALMAGVSVLLAACQQTPAPARVPAPPPTVVHEVAAPETQAHFDHRAYVRKLQAALTMRGYHAKVDGVCGPETQRAIAAYQFDIGVPRQTDGQCRISHQTWSGLGLSSGSQDNSAPADSHYE